MAANSSTQPWSMDSPAARENEARRSEVAQYHAGVDAEVERAVAALDAAFSDLRQQRQQRLASIAAQRREQYEKEQHEQELARVEAARRADAEKERLDRERWLRQKETDEARKRQEEQRQQHTEATARARKEEAARRAEIEEAKKSADAAETRAAEAAAKASAEARQRPSQASGATPGSAFRANNPLAGPSPSSQAGKPAAFGASATANDTSVNDKDAGAVTSSADATAKSKAGTGAATPSKTLGTAWEKVDAEFQSAQDRIAWIRENVKLQLKQQPKNVQDRVRDLQADLRARFGMLTDSKRKLLEVREVVRSHFLEAKESGNNVAYMAVLNAFAKLLVSQGEAEAQKTIERALPLAMLTILLWDEFRELGDFVIPRFIKKCPQVIGYSSPITTEEGRKRMGWKRDGSSGRYESEERYVERIAGICSVWSAMTQTKMSATKPTVHPYPITHSWIFLARHLNRPREEVTAADYAAVGAWWDMTATRFYEAFGKQAHKLLTAVWDAWTDDRMEFPALRLRGLGEDWQATGKLEHAWKPLAA